MTQFVATQYPVLDLMKGVASVILLGVMLTAFGGMFIIFIIRLARLPR